MKLIISSDASSEEATRQLMEWSAALGYKTKPNSKGDIFSVRLRYTYSVWMTSGPDLRRVIVTGIFPGNKNNRDPEGRCRFANELNSRYNICKFSFDAEGDLCCQQALYVDGELTPGMWRGFLDQCDQAIGWAFDRHRDEFTDLIS